jgi:uncharacterized protein YuzB (UPF0349 family)
MSIEMFDDDNDDLDVVQYECWYWSVIDSMAELIMNNGQGKVMSHVAEAVLNKVHSGYVTAQEDPFKW